MWREATEQVADMMAMEPYPGFEGEFFSMPCRNVVPKPMQKPHPPLWVACSNPAMIRTAARHGLGALTFAFVEPQDAAAWVDDYYSTLREECVPLGHAINPNIAMVTGFSCHGDSQTAWDRVIDGISFFGFGLAHFLLHGWHKPGHTNLWQEFKKQPPYIHESLTRGIGTPDQVRETMRQYSNSGVDHVIFIQQGGNNQHDHICESLELFAAEVLPEFHAEEAQREERKLAELAPFLNNAMKA